MSVYICTKYHLAMALTTLKDDLLQEFREECIMINEQMELLDPLGTALRMPAAQRLLSSTTLAIAEFGCYTLSLGGVAFIAMMHRIYPFTLLPEFIYNPKYEALSGKMNLIYFSLGVYGLAGLLTILIFVIGRMAREIRLKNNILHTAGTNIKIVLGQHLERKAAIESIQQRHLLGVSGISKPVKQAVKVNEVMNPGYDVPEETEAPEQHGQQQVPQTSGNTVTWKVQ